MMTRCVDGLRNYRCVHALQAPVAVGAEGEIDGVAPGSGNLSQRLQELHTVDEHDLHSSKIPALVGGSGCTWPIWAIDVRLLEMELRCRFRMRETHCLTATDGGR